MIRTAAARDISAIIHLSVVTGMFAAEDTGDVKALLDAHFSAGADADGVCLVDDEEGVVRAAAYCAPEAATDRVWNLTMIAVHPDHQGHGLGGALMARLEDTLRAHGQRMMVVDTSGLPQYDRTRAFYERNGYQKVAHIPDFWSDGDDLVIFSKKL
jgi:ribosomal protein S18 acetylase RimI-like enzyme